MATWDVWSALRSRGHVTLEWGYITGARGLLEDIGHGWRRITLDARLSRRDRRAVLAHELVHDERGILFQPGTPRGIIAKEEALVDAEATRRLVPPAELAELVRARVLDGGTVEWRDVSDWFDVPQTTAQRALDMLERTTRRRHPSGRVTLTGSAVVAEYESQP